MTQFDRRLQEPPQMYSCLSLPRSLSLSVYFFYRSNIFKAIQIFSMIPFSTVVFFVLIFYGLYAAYNFPFVIDQI